MVRQREFDVAELGLTYYLRTLDQEDPPFIALPIFPNRNFRHSAIFINTSKGITRPQDLAGKTIGEFALYGHDAGVWPKGILADEYGVTPDRCRWIIGGTDRPIPQFSWIPQPHPANIEVTHAPDGKALGPMLEAGEIDALISVDVPQCVLNHSPQVARLFPDYESVERAYYQHTRIYPIMHAVVICGEILTRHPELARAIYRGFCDSKEAAMQQYREGARKQHLAVMVPWFSQLFDENRRLLSDDWWPSGIKANRKAIDTYLRYHFEQGLSKAPAEVRGDLRSRVTRNVTWAGIERRSRRGSIRGKLARSLLCPVAGRRCDQSPSTYTVWRGPFSPMIFLRFSS